MCIGDKNNHNEFDRGNVANILRQLCVSVGKYESTRLRAFLFPFSPVVASLSQFSLSRFPNFSYNSKQQLPVWYHIHIWHVSPLFIYGDPEQILTWLKVSNLCFLQHQISCNVETSEWNHWTWSYYTIPLYTPCKCGLLQYYVSTLWIILEILLK